MKQIIYETDYGYLFTDIKQENFFQYDSSLVDVDLRSGTTVASSNSIGSVSFLNYHKVDFYNRSFEKLQFDHHFIRLEQHLC
jgi:hypothetical protein